MITIEQAKPFYAGTDSAHDFDHILRVVSLADRIARAEGADLEVVRTAALLHDIARADEDHAQGPEGKPLDHADLSADMARELLLSNGATDDFAERVAEAIRAHRFRGDRRPDSLEGQVLFDADKLDAIGAIGVARAFAVAGALNQKLYTEPDLNDSARRDQHNSDHSPVAEFVVKLSKLRERMHTPTAQAIATERQRFMVEFFRRLSQEVNGDC